MDLKTKYKKETGLNPSATKEIRSGNGIYLGEEFSHFRREYVFLARKSYCSEKFQ